MANTSLEQALDDLYRLLTEGGTPDGVQKVYDHEPGAAQVQNRSVTMSCSGITPDDFQLVVRIYVTATDARNAQRAIYQLIESVDARLGERLDDDVGPFGPSRWEIGYDTTSGAHVAQSTLDAGREDASFTH